MCAAKVSPGTVNCWTTLFVLSSGLSKEHLWTPTADFVNIWRSWKFLNVPGCTGPLLLFWAVEICSTGVFSCTDFSACFGWMEKMSTSTHVCFQSVKCGTCWDTDIREMWLRQLCSVIVGLCTTSSIWSIFRWSHYHSSSSANRKGCIIVNRMSSFHHSDSDGESTCLGTKQTFIGERSVPNLLRIRLIDSLLFNHGQLYAKNI